MEKNKKNAQKTETDMLGLGFDTPAPVTPEPLETETTVTVIDPDEAGPAPGIAPEGVEPPSAEEFVAMVQGAAYPNTERLEKPRKARTTKTSKLEQLEKDFQRAENPVAKSDIVIEAIGILNAEGRKLSDALRENAGARDRWRARFEA